MLKREMATTSSCSALENLPNSVGKSPFGSKKKKRRESGQSIEKVPILVILHKEKITCQGFFSNFCFENAWELGASKKLQDLMDKSLADQVGMVSSISCHLLRYLLSLHEFSTKFSQIFVPSNHITGAGRF